MESDMACIPTLYLHQDQTLHYIQVLPKTVTMASSQESALCDFLVTPLQRMHLIRVDSVQRWMEELRYMSEVECMCILQSKPISVDEDVQSELIVNPEQPSRDGLHALLKRALIVSGELSKLFQKLEKNRWQRAHSTAVRTNCHVRSLVNEYHSLARSASAVRQQSEQLLLDKCMELTVLTERCTHTDDEYFLKTMKESILEILTAVEESFSEMIDAALTGEIQVLLRQLESSDNTCAIGMAIDSLLDLTQEGAHLCSMLAKEGAVVALFKICRQDCFRSLYASALRTLASVCCVDEGIQQLEKVDGILCLADILADESINEATRSEAAAVVAQITSPHYAFTQHLSSFLENMEDMVTALLNLCQNASSGEVFLLASAALANITFLDTMAGEILLQLGAIGVLFEAFQDQRRVDTPYSKDQVVTILANMSVLDQCALEVLQHNGVECLLAMLSEKPSSSSPAEGAACERVQQKAAVTLARLSRHPLVAQAAAQKHCIPRLIELCRSPAERNNSDSVLVACLAALRRLAASCPERIQDSDFQQLIKPRLVDSFLLCSNMEESFV
ncbi:protein inscuteable homolog isoform X1 [Polypterus senegalus]|uniref:protein inscuteable homolog isoform X1 n=2 Tax=Polypterus senegalus TaxID=55291 RepID=UPI0019633B83|nr:protein inscuteable homolog isoform X1 [Polypterus senegalus]